MIKSRFSQNGHFWTPLKLATLDPFLDHFWAISRTSRSDPSTWKGLKNAKKRVQKMAKNGPTFGPKMGHFWHPKVSNLTFWRQNVKFFGSRGVRDTPRPTFWTTFWTPFLASFHVLPKYARNCRTNNTYINKVVKKVVKNDPKIGHFGSFWDHFWTLFYHFICVRIIWPTIACIFG